MHAIFLNGIWSGSNIETIFTRSFSCYALKHWLSHARIKSKVIDYCQHLNADDITSLLDLFISKDTLVLGVSTTFWPLSGIPKNIASAIQHVRDKYPHVKIISGGAKTTSAELFDKVFVGEAEDPLVAYVKELQGRQTIIPMKKFNIVNQDFAFDVDDAILDGEALPLELGRGCIFKCKFCAHQNLGKSKYTYQRSFENVVKEIENNKKLFNTSNYLFLDDTVNEDVDKIRNMSTIPALTGVDVNWVGYLRADLVWSKEESQDLLVKSGLKACFFGIETLNLDAGKSINKGWGAKHGREFLPILYEEIWGKQVSIHSNFIVGLPHETKETLHETLDWCLNTKIGSHRFAPLTLYLERNDAHLQSEFTRNYKDYGYKNVHTDGYYWETDHITSVEAVKFANHANRKLRQVNSISTWDIMSAVNLGLNVEEARKLTAFDYTMLVLRNRIKFKERYLEKLKLI